MAIRNFYSSAHLHPTLQWPAAPRGSNRRRPDNLSVFEKINFHKLFTQRERRNVKHECCWRSVWHIIHLLEVILSSNHHAFMRPSIRTIFAQPVEKILLWQQRMQLHTECRLIMPFLRTYICTGTYSFCANESDVLFYFNFCYFVNTYSRPKWCVPMLRLRDDVEILAMSRARPLNGGKNYRFYCLHQQCSEIFTTKTLSRI